MALGICLWAACRCGCGCICRAPIPVCRPPAQVYLSLVLSAQDAFIFAPSTQAQANAEANKAQSEQAAMENEAGTAQTQPAAQMGQVQQRRAGLP